MKWSHLILLTIIFFGCSTFAGKKPLVDVTGIKVPIAEDADAVVKANVKGADTVEADVDAKGVDLSKREDSSIDAGGDVSRTDTQTITNDPKLLKYIFGTIIGAMGLIIRKLMKDKTKMREAYMERLEEKDKMLLAQYEMMDRKDDRNDKFLRDLIMLLMKELKIS